jgi:hypothetical protein
MASSIVQLCRILLLGEQLAMPSREPIEVNQIAILEIIVVSFHFEEKSVSAWSN